VVKGITEFRSNDMHFHPWRTMTERDLKSIVVEEMKEGGESWMNDMRSEQYTLTPRLCSFIATTNDRSPLPSRN